MCVQWSKKYNFSNIQYQNLSRQISLFFFFLIENIVIGGRHACMIKKLVLQLCDSGFSPIAQPLEQVFIIVLHQSVPCEQRPCVYYPHPHCLTTMLVCLCSPNWVVQQKKLRDSKRISTGVNLFDMVSQYGYSAITGIRDKKKKIYSVNKHKLQACSSEFNISTASIHYSHSEFIYEYLFNNLSLKFSRTNRTVYK